MSNQQRALEGQLRELMQRQTDEFEAADEILTRFAAAIRDSQPVGQCRTNLDAALASFNQSEQAIQSFRSAWSVSGQRPGATLQEAIDRQQQTLRQLIARIDAIETEVKDKRQQLKPELDAAAMTSRMQTAYARGSRRD